MCLELAAEPQLQGWSVDNWISEEFAYEIRQTTKDLLSEARVAKSQSSKLAILATIPLTAATISLLYLAHLLEEK